MNVFATALETPQDLAARLANDLQSVIAKGHSSGAAVQVSDITITISLPSGSTLDIACDGPDAFRLEDDKASREQMVRAQMGRWAGNQVISQGAMVASVTQWLKESR